jgi:hypothetical protein
VESGILEVSFSLSPEVNLLSGDWDILSCGVLSGELGFKGIEPLSGLALDEGLSLLAVSVVFSGLLRSMAEDFPFFSELVICDE